MITEIARQVCLKICVLDVESDLMLVLNVSELKDNAAENYTELLLPTGFPMGDRIDSYLCIIDRNPLKVMSISVLNAAGNTHKSVGTRLHLAPINALSVNAITILVTRFSPQDEILALRIHIRNDCLHVKVAVHATLILKTGYLKNSQNIVSKLLTPVARYKHCKIILVKTVISPPYGSII